MLRISLYFGVCCSVSRSFAQVVQKSAYYICNCKSSICPVVLAVVTATLCTCFRKLNDDDDDHKIGFINNTFHRCAFSCRRKALLKLQKAAVASRVSLLQSAVMVEMGGRNLRGRGEARQAPRVVRYGEEGEGIPS